MAVVACQGGDTDGLGGIGAASYAYAVVQGTVVSVSGGELQVADAADVAWFKRRGGDDPVAAVEAGTQTDLTLRYDTGDFEVGRRYAIFVGTWDAKNRSVAFAYDLDNDQVVAPWSRRKSGNGSTPAQVLECLRFEVPGAADRSDLQVIIDTVIEYNETGDSDSSLRRCTSA
jgi:hypothetical protein